jgi:phage recombination protein Bet
MQSQPGDDMEAKTQQVEQVDAQVVSLVHARTGALPSRWNPPTWDEERVALARKAVTPPSATQAEFEFFLAWAKRTGLDPFTKQCYLIERWDAQTNTKKHEPMASEQGMAARMDAEPDYRGMKSGVVYAGDVFDVDEDAGTVTHKWNPTDRAKGGMKILGAWAHAKREGRVIEITYLTLESRIGKKRDGSVTKFWATDPAGQLRKCARADQSRRAYPNLLGGIYVEAEMRRDEEEEYEAPKTEPVQSRTNAVLAKVQAKVAPKPSPAKAAALPETAPAPITETQPIDAEVTFSCVQRGKNKGKPISGLDAVELAESIAEHEAGLAKTPSAESKAQVAAWLAELRAEEGQRMDEIGGAT